MRANAPFPVLLAFLGIGIVFASALLPATLSAKPAKKHVVAARKAITTSVKHPAAHAVARKMARQTASQSKRHPLQEAHHQRIAQARPSRRHARKSSEKEAQTDSTANRVHAWVKTQKQIALADQPKLLPNGANASEADPDTTQPVSVISTIRNTNPTVVPRPQLPPVEDLVADSMILPTLYNRRGRLVVPPALKGSHEILIHQNLMADDEGLDRIRDDADLDRLRHLGALIAIPTSATLRVDERLPANRRYCRPWTALFLDTLARQHYAHFQSALQVNSAVRTVEFQQQLIHRNGNAAPAEGDTASPHLTGQAIDIQKKGLSMAEIAWLRGYLLPLVQQGKVDVEEEFQQSCFHISVYKKYMPQDANRRVIATTHREGMPALAMGLHD